MKPSLEQARNWYSATDPVHGFDHISRVYYLAQRIGRAEGANLRIVSAAALLHDYEGDQLAEKGSDKYAVGLKSRVNHQQTATDFCNVILEEEGWSAADIHAVQHCIRSHRFRDLTEQPRTLEAQVLFDADKLDAMGAVGAARAIAYAAREGYPAFCMPSQTFLTSGELEESESHSAYHEYLYKLRNIRSCLYTITGKLLAEERHHRMVDFFEQLAAESLGEA